MADDERVVFETGFHPTYLSSTAVFAACVAGATALVVYRNPLETASIVQLWLAALAVIAIGAAAPIHRWWTSRLVVSTQRLTVQSGGFRGQRIEIPLNRLAEITVTPGVLGRLLGYGTVRIVATGEPPVVFTRVAAPTALRDAAMRQPHAPRRRSAP